MNVMPNKNLSSLSTVNRGPQIEFIKANMISFFQFDGETIKVEYPDCLKVTQGEWSRIILIKAAGQGCSFQLEKGASTVSILVSKHGPNLLKLHITLLNQDGTLLSGPYTTHFDSRCRQS